MVFNLRELHKMTDDQEAVSIHSAHKLNNSAYTIVRRKAKQK